MTNKIHTTTFQDGDPIHASDWNDLAMDVNELKNTPQNNTVECTSIGEEGADPKASVTVNSGIEEIGTSEIIQLTKKSKGINTTITATNNINIEPRESTGKAKNTKGGNISLKPGDDIELCSHHRRFGNRDEVTIKVIDGEENPVKLQVKAGDITLSTEGKDQTKTKDEDTGLDTQESLYNDPNVMNINVTTGSGKGYLKVRAQAIDLRCEENGGIALQPKGTDGNGHENKIKFEHNGGDGKEFGTFNTEKTSIFTDEYRFNVAGEIYAVTRGALETTYKVPDDPNSGVKKIDYPTQSDDFKDVIDSNTPHCSWGDIIKFIAWAKEHAAGSAWENLWSAPL